MQTQQNWPTTADTSNGHASTHPVSSAQGPVNPNEGAFEPPTPQTNISNHGFVQQNGQNPSLNYDVFGQNNQTNVDPNLGDFVQDFQSIDQSNNNPFPNQFDGANSVSPDAAVFQNQGFELPQSQSGSSNGWMEFLGNDAMDGLDFDFSLSSAPQGDFVTNQQAIPPQQDVAQQHSPQQVVQQQPAEHQMAQQDQPVEQDQPAQEQQAQMWQQFDEDPLQQQFPEAENAQQVAGDVDLYGLNYQQLVADLQSVAEFNVQN